MAIILGEKVEFYICFFFNLHVWCHALVNAVKACHTHLEAHVNVVANKTLPVICLSLDMHMLQGFIQAGCNPTTCHGYLQ